MSVLARIDTVLIVEEDYFLASDLGETLKDLGCTTSRIARTVPESLAAIEQGVQFVTLNIKVGQVSCLEVAESLAARQIPFVYVTGYNEADHRSLPRAPWAGKPMDVDRLVEAINSQFQSA
jgi:CheY-like chemotaxis protein